MTTVKPSTVEAQLNLALWDTLEVTNSERKPSLQGCRKQIGCCQSPLGAVA
jgi:hypothetical protein